ncbi:MAG: hypothetical protein R2875_03925 [Desulfobacterales bacterium]
MEDAGALLIECDVTKIRHGDTITVLPWRCRILNADTGEELARFTFKPM